MGRFKTPNFSVYFHEIPPGRIDLPKLTPNVYLGDIGFGEIGVQLSEVISKPESSIRLTNREKGTETDLLPSRDLTKITMFDILLELLFN